MHRYVLIKELYAYQKFLCKYFVNSSSSSLVIHIVSRIESLLGIIFGCLEYSLLESWIYIIIFNTFCTTISWKIYRNAINKATEVHQIAFYYTIQLSFMFPPLFGGCPFLCSAKNGGRLNTETASFSVDDDPTLQSVHL